MGKGGYKSDSYRIIDQGGLYYVSFAVVAWVDVLYQERIQGYCNRKFAALPAEKRAGIRWLSDLWMVHYE